MPKNELPQEIFQNEDELALHTFEQNREQMIKFHEELAAVGQERHIPKNLREEAQSGIRDFLRAGITINEEIKSLSRKRIEKRSFERFAQESKQIRSGAELDSIVARLSLALYLFERTKEMHNTVMEKDSLPLYALFASVRNETAKILSPDFFKKSTKDIITDYLRIEAIFVACNKVCGMEAMAINDAVKKYKMELRNEVIRKMVEGKKRE